MDEFIKKVVDKVCNKLKKDDNIVGIILYGSIAKGNYHRYSDIDFYVVKSNVKNKTTVFFEDDIPVQIIWRSIESFKTKIIKRTRGIPIGLVGEILYDPSGLISKYMKKLKLQAAEGPIELSEQEKLIIRVILSQDLKTVEGLVENDEIAGATILANEILLQALSGYYDLKKWWFPSNKHIISDLKFREKQIGELAEQIILCSNINEKIEKLSKLTDIVLSEMGGAIEEYEIIW